MLDALLVFAVSTAVVVLAGVFLTRFADGISDATGLGRLLVGSIFLAGATSLPELMVDVNAAWLMNADLAVGGIVGSSLFNLWILAMLCLLPSVRGSMLSPDYAHHKMSVKMSIALTLLAAAGLALGVVMESLRQPPIVPGGILGLGGPIILIGYIVGIRKVFQDQKQREAEGEQAPEDGRKRPSIWLAGIGYIVSAGIILVAAKYVASSAEDLAKLTGLGNTFVGTTLVALATSLPELVTTLSAVRMKAYDLALGNIFGSNSFNILLLLPVDLFYRAGEIPQGGTSSGSLLDDASGIHLLTCFATVMVSLVAVRSYSQASKEKHPTATRKYACLIVLLVVTALSLIYHYR